MRHGDWIGLKLDWHDIGLNLILSGLDRQASQTRLYILFCFLFKGIRSMRKKDEIAEWQANQTQGLLCSV